MTTKYTATHNQLTSPETKNIYPLTLPYTIFLIIGVKLVVRYGIVMYYEIII